MVWCNGSDSCRVSEQTTLFLDAMLFCDFIFKLLSLHNIRCFVFRAVMDFISLIYLPVSVGEFKIISFQNYFGVKCPLWDGFLVHWTPKAHFVPENILPMVKKVNRKGLGFNIICASVSCYEIDRFWRESICSTFISNWLQEHEKGMFVPCTVYVSILKISQVQNIF